MQTPAPPLPNKIVGKIGSVGKARGFVRNLPNVHVNLESTVFTWRSRRVVKMKAFSIYSIIKFSWKVILETQMLALFCHYRLFATLTYINLVHAYSI